MGVVQETILRHATFGARGTFSVERDCSHGNTPRDELIPDDLSEINRTLTFAGTTCGTRILDTRNHGVVVDPETARTDPPSYLDGDFFGLKAVPVKERVENCRTLTTSVEQ
jgi:hypothetical protein